MSDKVCSVPDCKALSLENVELIECTACSNWFHEICLDIRTFDFDKSKFVCANCMSNGPQNLSNLNISQSELELNLNHKKYSELE